MENEAIKYNKVYDKYFWDISKETTADPPNYVFELSNQMTIAYHTYIKEVVDFIAVSGCPSLGALFLTIIATNPDCDEDIEYIKSFAYHNRTAFSIKEDHFRFQSAIDFLYILKSLPEEYKSGENRKLLFRLLFQNAHNAIGAQKAKKVLKDFDSALETLVNSQKDAFNKAVFINDFRTIAILKKTFPLKESIITAFHKVVDVNFQSSLKEAVLDNEKETSLHGADFDTILINNSETFHIGSLIKNIWAGLSVPMHHNFAGIQPLGGVADLTNKGDFDKLLISEFAYDDDVFMSRVANNEALYIEREIPPQKNTFIRYILIDTSIYNWGIPKKIALAMALAMAKHPKNQVETKIVLVGDTIDQMPYQTVSDIVQSTKIISNKIDCALGLESFFKENELKPNQSEVFFIGAEQVFNVEKFQRVLYNHFEQINYVFSISLEGFVQVFKHQTKAKTLLQTICLPLEELWKKSKNSQQEQSSIIHNEENLPILYHVVPEFGKLFSFENDIYFVRNFCLYKFHQADFKKGVELVFVNLPVTSGEFLLRRNNKNHLVLYCKSEKGIKYIVDISIKEIRVLNQNQEFPNDVIEDQKIFLQLQKSGYLKISVKQTLEKAFIAENALYINGYKFDNFYFTREDRTLPKILQIENNNKIEFSQKANLYYKKNRGGANLEIIKCIREHTDKSLQEATAILNSTGSIVLNDVFLGEAESLKSKLEALGAVCYIKISSLYTYDGRIITLNHGTLKLEDTTSGICIFIPFVLKSHTIVATNEYYAGNSFYVPTGTKLKKISEAEFTTKFLHSFINKKG